jgi:UDPglucose 6-dehydrogenase
MMWRVAVVGLGKLGACIAACFARKGVAVTGVDVSPRTVQLVNDGIPPVFEPGLAEMMAMSRANLVATTDFCAAITQSDASFIVVPTPSDDDGGFSLRHVEEAARFVGRALRGSNDYHVVVLTSTVLPGATQSTVLPILEAESGRRCGEDFGLCYSPEFIALGTVMRDFLNPDFVLIGESDQRAGRRLADLYKCICENQPPVMRMNFVNAELAKISLNSFVTMKISFANTLAALCERLPGGDVDVVTGAVGMDSRIGLRYLKGGVGYGGPCFPRDNRAFAHLAHLLGEEALLAEATDSCNRSVLARLVTHVTSEAPCEGTVAILGLAYKPNSTVVEASQGLEVADQLSSEGFRVVVYDPVALDEARRRLGDRVSYGSSVEAAVQGADVVLLANPDPAFRDIHLADGANGGRPVVIDAWRMLRRHDDGSGPAYVPLGVGPRVDVEARSERDGWSEIRPQNRAGARGWSTRSRREHVPRFKSVRR